MTVSEIRLAGLLLALAVMSAGCSGDDHGDDEDHGDEEAATAIADHVEIDTLLLAKGLVGTDTAIMMHTGSMRVVGEVTWLPDRVGMVSAPVPGRLMSVSVAPGTRVVSGSVLATMQSPEVSGLQVEYREASELARIARQNYDRQARLESEGVVARRNVLEAEATLRQYELAAEGARVRLGIIGADTAGGMIAISSPIAGTVLTRTAGPGQMVTSEMMLFTVADLSTVMLEVAVPEREIARIRPGMEAVATVSAWPGRIFRGRVSEVAGGVDATTRTVVARIELPNRDMALRAGMHAGIDLIGEDSGNAPAVPAEAVQRIDGRQIVFIPGEEPGEFELREVVAEPSGTSGWMIIRNGVAVGERLVTTGAFLLRSELSRGEMQDHGH